MSVILIIACLQVPTNSWSDNWGSDLHDPTICDVLQYILICNDMCGTDSSNTVWIMGTLASKPICSCYKLAHACEQDCPWAGCSSTQVRHRFTNVRVCTERILLGFAKALGKTNSMTACKDKSESDTEQWARGSGYNSRSRVIYYTIT
jgi:hypothetical protein